MKLTPLDIKRHQFEKGFRGYDPDEVDGFLKQVADRFEAVLEELRLAHERTREVEGKLTHYERVELALQEALESAKTSAKRTEEDAARRAAVITEEAELRAQQILQDVERERFGMKQDLIKLSARQAEVAARLRGFLMSELQVVSDFQGSDRHGLLQPGDAGRLLDRAAEPEADTPSLAQGDADLDPISALDGPGTDDTADGWADPEAGVSEASWADLESDVPSSDAVDAAADELRADELRADEEDTQVDLVAPAVSRSREASQWDIAEPPPQDPGGPGTEGHAWVSSQADAEALPLAPGESGIVGEASPVEPSRPATPPVMPSDPWAIPQPSVSGSDAERERIRRILEDLD